MRNDTVIHAGELTLLEWTPIRPKYPLKSREHILLAM
jgi:hypothetical protein